MSSENTCTILLGNPTRSSGFFSTRTIARPMIADPKSELRRQSGRVADEYIQEMSQRYGEESNAFRVRVLGEFPARDDDTAIPLELVEAAQNREVEVLEDEPIIWGLDVARFGSAKSVLCKRQGRKILALTSWKNLDLMRLAGAIVCRI